MNLFVNGHALLIGVGADLPNTVVDAEGIASLLGDPERCAYPRDQVRVLSGAGATRGHILSALDGLAASAGPAATVLFYFSGHGFEVDTAIGKQYFLMPFGYDVHALTTTAISGAELTTKLGSIRAQKMLVLLDCCHAGGLDSAIEREKAPGVTFTKAPLPQGSVEELAKGSGRVIISSCCESEKSYTGVPYSQFTQALIEALAGRGTAKGDGYVKAADLAMYAAKTVPHHTSDRQNPVLNFDEADNFNVAYYAGGEMEPKALPAGLQRKAHDIDGETAQPPSGPSVTSTGSGGVATGESAKAAGERGVVAETIHGDVIMGDHARKISTGTYIERQDVRHGSTFNQSGQRVGKQINVSGDRVGRDKLIRGDEVGGDKIEVGDVSDSTVALGRGARATSQTAPSRPDRLAQILAPIVEAAAQKSADDDGRAVQLARALADELSGSAQADDKRVAKQIQGLAVLLPNAAQLFGPLAREEAFCERTGEVTQFVLEQVLAP